MLIPLEDCKTFSSCPAFYNFAKKDPPLLPINRRLSILLEVIQQIYFFQLEGSKPNQRQIIGWVDKRVFKDIDITNDEQVEKGKELAESVLLPLRAWYEQYFLKEHTDGYISVPLSCTVGGHQIHHVAPIVKLQEPLTVMVIGDVVQTKFALYNNLLARGMAWMLAKQLGQTETRIEYLFVGPREHVDLIELTCTEELNGRTEKMLLDIADSVARGVNYPSITSMCTTCPFKKRCLI